MRIKKPRFPKKGDVVRISEVKSWAMCHKCGKKWNQGLLESFEFDKAEITNEEIKVPMKQGCNCGKPADSFWIGTEELITGCLDPSNGMDYVAKKNRKELEENGVIVLE